MGVEKSEKVGKCQKKSENVGKSQKKSEKCWEKSENHRKNKYFPTIFRYSTPMMEIFNTGNANLFPMPLMGYSSVGKGNSRRILTFPMVFFTVHVCLLPVYIHQLLL